MNLIGEQAASDFLLIALAVCIGLVGFAALLWFLLIALDREARSAKLGTLSNGTSSTTTSRGRGRP